MRKILVILLGVIFIGVGIFVLIQSNDLAKKCTEENIATIVNYHIETSTDSDNNITYTYYPIINYNVGTKSVTKQSKTGYGNEKYNINEKITILYNPNNVEEFIIKGDKTGNILGIAVIVAGAIALVLGIFKRNF